MLTHHQHKYELCFFQQANNPYQLHVGEGKEEWGVSVLIRTLK